MRGDRPANEPESLGRQDAADAGAGTIHHPLQARDGQAAALKALSCDETRHLLGASRRDDWTLAELQAVTAHLAGCAECRKKQADYRLAGEMIRDLPTIVPPASFRESVFAAIAAEVARTEAAAQS